MKMQPGEAFIAVPAGTSSVRSKHGMPKAHVPRRAQKTRTRRLEQRSPEVAALLRQDIVQSGQQLLNCHNFQTILKP